MSEAAAGNFIRQIIETDLAEGKHERIVTRFPPEPNGFLHIGHAKSICLNFGIGRDYAGSHCNLRFDDTNPEKENEDFVRAIQEDVRWLGFDWGEQTLFASDYFERLYAIAESLIERGLAYVDDSSAEEIRRLRGSLTEPGTDSPYRSRSPGENLDLFRRMRAGEFEDGSRLLRARIDMAHPNMNMRDPALYRIRRAHHHNTGDAWCIYPMYDFTHPLSDAFEGVTHSLCTLEFEDHRPLYDWVIAHSGIEAQPRQIEFSRLNLQYTVTSKRKLTQLVDEGHVKGWDDPRLPTLSGMRRRGYPAAAIRDFCDRIGVTKSENVIEPALLEACVREDLDRTAPRRMVVLNPLRVVIENFTDLEQTLVAANHPKDPSMGSRDLVLTGEIFIDQADYLPEANKKFKRLVDGGAVRLRNGYVIQHVETEWAEDGSPVLLRVRHYPDSLESNPQGVKVRGVIHWVSARDGVPAEVRLYEPLFNAPSPGAESGDFKQDLSPDSLRILGQAVVEPGYRHGGPVFQFEREGYFVLDEDSTAERPVFNQTTGLRDSWGTRG